MDMKAIKMIGYVATGVGFATSVVGAWVEDKKLDETIATKVAEAVAKLTGSES